MIWFSSNQDKNLENDFGEEIMKELFGKIIDKTGFLTNNPHLVFNFLEIFYLLDIVSVIVFKEDICSFCRKRFWTYI